MGPDDTRGSVLARRASEGDRQAERELCRRVGPAVRAFARRRLASATAVDDFVQDVMLVVLEALRAGRVEDPSRIASFVLGVCRNLARERARVRDRRRDAVARFFEEPEPTLPWEPRLLGRARLEDCLSTLTPRARSVLRRSYADEERDSDIASALSMTESNVRVTRHRTLTSLRECLEKGDISWERR